MDLDKITQGVYNELPDYQKRMVDEYSELEERVTKLGQFMRPENKVWCSLNCEEQTDMWTQYHAMVIYKIALMSRLERANIKEIFFPTPYCCGA